MTPAVESSHLGHMQEGCGIGALRLSTVVSWKNLLQKTLSSPNNRILVEMWGSDMHPPLLPHMHPLWVTRNKARPWLEGLSVEYPRAPISHG